MSQNQYAEAVTADIRYTALRALSTDPDYSHNEGVIQSALRALGHAVSRDRVRTELSWMAEQGLITVDTVSGVMVARLTDRGADCAAGLTHIPGVRRPRPGE